MQGGAVRQRSSMEAQQRAGCTAASSPPLCSLHHLIWVRWGGVSLWWGRLSVVGVSMRSEQRVLLSVCVQPGPLSDCPSDRLDRPDEEHAATLVLQKSATFQLLKGFTQELILVG